LGRRRRIWAWDRASAAITPIILPLGLLAANEIVETEDVDRLAAVEPHGSPCVQLVEPAEQVVIAPELESLLAPVRERAHDEATERRRPPARSSRKNSTATTPDRRSRDGQARPG
jgi:hypothetical protein